MNRHRTHLLVTAAALCVAAGACREQGAVDTDELNLKMSACIGEDGSRCRTAIEAVAEEQIAGILLRCIAVRAPESGALWQVPLTWPHGGESTSEDAFEIPADVPLLVAFFILVADSEDEDCRAWQVDSHCVATDRCILKLGPFNVRLGEDGMTTPDLAGGRPCPTERGLLPRVPLCTAQDDGCGGEAPAAVDASAESRAVCDAVDRGCATGDGGCADGPGDAAADATAGAAADALADAALDLATAGCSPIEGPDLCDGHDSDCDGAVDEDFVGRRCLPDEGIDWDLGPRSNCEEGREACEAGHVRCNEARSPQEEVCSQEGALPGRDEDCDGQVDEGCVDGGPCRATPPACDGDAVCVRDQGAEARCVLACPCRECRRCEELQVADPNFDCEARCVTCERTRAECVAAGGACQPLHRDDGSDADGETELCRPRCAADGDCFRDGECCGLAYTEPFCLSHDDAQRYVGCLAPAPQ